MSDETWEAEGGESGLTWVEFRLMRTTYEGTLDLYQCFLSTIYYLGKAPKRPAFGVPVNKTLRTETYYSVYDESGRRRTWANLTPRLLGKKLSGILGDLGMKRGVELGL